MKPYEELFDSSITPENDKWTKDTLAGLPTCKGVLLFTDTSRRPIQLLRAANCRRTAQAKLLQDDTDTGPRKKADVSELTAAIYFRCCYNNFLSQLTYTQLAHTIFEKDADTWIQLPKISSAVIETDAFLPYFYVTDAAPSQRHQKRFGLFPTRKAVAEFCDILNTVFLLCRNPSLLKTGKEPSCPYLQMETCAGPCLNPKPRERYAVAVNQAVTTAAGNLEETQQQLRQTMQQRSAKMDFENAQNIKKKLELLGKLTRSDFQWVHDMDELCILHIDTGPKEKDKNTNRKIRQLMWFKITSQGIYHLGNLLPNAEKDIKDFLEQKWIEDSTGFPRNSLNEQLSILSLQLYRSHRCGIWIDCARGIRLEAIVSELNSCFNLEVNASA